MDKMMKDCMTPHAIYHTIIGIGLGIILVSLVPSVGGLVIGVVVVVVGGALDMMMKRK